MSKKRGRPCKEAKRDKQCKIWFTKRELDEIDIFCDLTDTNRSDFIRNAIKSHINLAKFRLNL